MLPILLSRTRFTTASETEVRRARDGVQLAEKYRWDIGEIVHVFAAALEDSNAHTLRKKIIETWESECKETADLPNPFETRTND